MGKKKKSGKKKKPEKKKKEAKKKKADKAGAGLGKADFNLEKLEKGPLQRFKNQNLLLRKFGEVGLRIYRAITGKRTKEQLKKDLGTEPDIFDSVVEFMRDAEIVKLTPVGEKKAAPAEAPPEEEEIAVEEAAPSEEEISIGEEEVPSLEELPEEFPEEIEKPLEEKKIEKKKKKKAEEIEFEEVSAEEEIKPIEEGLPPIEELMEEEEKEEAGEEAKEEEAPPEEEEVSEEEEISPEEEFGFGEEEVPPEEEELSEAERKIKKKYGEVGLKVYTLIDGQRTAEEIMEETGLSEPKLIEILDFMDEKGIIKLDYPKGEEKKKPAAPWGKAIPGEEEEYGEEFAEEEKAKEAGFAPMLGQRGELGEIPVTSPVETPVKSPIDLIKSVHLKAKTILKFGEKGKKVLESIDGKNDVIDIALKVDIPLYETMDILSFLIDNEAVLMKGIPRDDVRRKYGEDGYAVYKKYGKEGLMLYELIGKDLTLKQMADKVMVDKTTIVEMFVFIYKVLNIELPLDEALLRKQLGLS